MNFDPNQTFVRVMELRQDDFVEFEFAIGEPELFVEMILPARAFDEFCALNMVRFIDYSESHGPVEAESEETREWDWHMKDATKKRFKS